MLREIDIKEIANVFKPFTFVKNSYSNADTPKFESLQKDESKAQPADSWKASSKPRALNGFFIMQTAKFRPNCLAAKVLIKPAMDARNSTQKIQVWYVSLRSGDVYAKHDKGI